MSKQLDKIYENFLEGTCKKYSVPAEAESLLKEGFAKYTAMCEASTTAHASFASDFANRICKFLIPHFQKTPDRGETLTAHFTIQDCPCDAKYTLDGFTIESGRYAPASMGLGKRNRKAFKKTEAATDSSGLSINEEEFAKLVNAYAAAVEGKEIKPIRIEVVKKMPLKDDGTLVRFHYDARDNGWSNAMTYALVYGDLHKNRDNDLLYILHDWQSGEKVTPEDIAEHDWELANDYIRPSEILAESKTNESAQYRVSVNFTPEPPFGYGDQDFLFKGLDIVDEEFSFPTREEAESFAQDCANRMTARNQDLESDGLQDGEIRVYYTNQDTVDRMVRNAGKAYAALWQDYDPENPPFPVLVARIGITRE